MLPGERPRLLAVRDLSVELLDRAPYGQGASRRILTEVSFDIQAGSIMGLFGESGCGKTTLVLALLNLLAPERYRVRGSVRLNDRELLSASERELERVRGVEISMIFQDPLLALNPLMRAGDQVREVMRAHGAAADSVEFLFELAGLPDRRIAEAYPHQLSGGERQRVAIAQAIACRPALVIADEPFTALDGPRVIELTALFRRLRETLGIAFLLISHSPGVLARTADEVLTMEGGRIVSRGTPAALLRAIPRFRSREERAHGA